MNQYLRARPIMESCPIEIPNARQCRLNHGLPPYENREIEKVILGIVKNETSHEVYRKL